MPEIVHGSASHQDHNCNSTIKDLREETSGGVADVCKASGCMRSRPLLGLRVGELIQVFSAFVAGVLSKPTGFEKVCPPGESSEPAPIQTTQGTDRSTHFPFPFP